MINDLFKTETVELDPFKQQDSQTFLPSLSSTTICIKID